MKLDNVVFASKNKTVYCNGDACIKVFGSECSKADVFDEALNQAKLEGTSIYSRLGLCFSV